MRGRDYNEVQKFVHWCQARSNLLYLFCDLWSWMCLLALAWMKWFLSALKLIRVSPQMLVLSRMCLYFFLSWLPWSNRLLSSFADAEDVWENLAQQGRKLVSWQQADCKVSENVLLMHKNSWSCFIGCQCLLLKQNQCFCITDFKHDDLDSTMFDHYTGAYSTQN